VPAEVHIHGHVIELFEIGIGVVMYSKRLLWNVNELTATSRAKYINPTTLLFPSPLFKTILGIYFTKNDARVLHVVLSASFVRKSL
jgi:hypothetical protein